MRKVSQKRGERQIFLPYFTAWRVFLCFYHAFFHSFRENPILNMDYHLRKRKNSTIFATSNITSKFYRHEKMDLQLRMAAHGPGIILARKLRRR